MIIVATFNPATVMSDTFSVPSVPGGKLLIYNESNISLQLVFQNGYTAYLPAWVGMLFPALSGSMTISWLQYAVLNSQQAPVQTVTVELFNCGEPIPGTYPVAMHRQTNVGNAIITG